MSTCRCKAVEVTSLHYIKMNCYSCGPTIQEMQCQCIALLDDCSLLLFHWMILPSTNLYDSPTIERLHWSPVVFNCLAIITHEIPKFFNLSSQNRVLSLTNYEFPNFSVSYFKISNPLKHEELINNI
jgi:hypothetical protein